MAAGIFVTLFGFAPTGTYQMFVMLTAAGSLADGVVDDGDVLALAGQAFTLGAPGPDGPPALPFD